MPSLIRLLARENRGQARFAVAAAFLFFVLYSAPHRVHHFFEQGQTASHDDADGHHGPSNGQNRLPNDSDCVFQASASRCSVGLTAEIQLPTLTLVAQGNFLLPNSSRQQQFLPGVFQIRAPPKN